MIDSGISFGERISSAFANVAQGLADRVPALSAAVVVLLVAWLVGRGAYHATQRMLARRSTAGRVDVLVARLARGGVLLLGIVVAMGVLGFDLGTLAASLGLAGLTLGFALRDVLANSVAGVMLLIQRPFRIGDTISVAGIEGVVEDVRIRDTVLHQPDGRLAYVPNTTVFNDVVVNLSDRTLRRFEIAVFVPLGADLESARRAVRDAVQANLDVAVEPPADASVASVGPTWARVVAHGWVDTREHGLESVRTPSLVAARDVVAALSGQVADG